MFQSKTAKTILLGGTGSGRRPGLGGTMSGMTAHEHSASGAMHDRMAKNSNEPAESEEHANLAAKDHGEAAELHEQDGNPAAAKASHLAAAASHQVAAKEATKQGDTYSANAHMNQAVGHTRQAKGM